MTMTVGKNKSVTSTSTLVAHSLVFTCTYELLLYVFSFSPRGQSDPGLQGHD